MIKDQRSKVKSQRSKVKKRTSIKVKGRQQKGQKDKTYFLVGWSLLNYACSYQMVAIF
jgi:hypothetical protein